MDNKNLKKYMFAYCLGISMLFLCFGNMLGAVYMLGMANLWYMEIIVDKILNHKQKKRRK